MNELLYFYLPNCPYCMKATVYLEQLLEEYPEFQTIPICRINERAQSDIANNYQYFFVPCFYLNGEKLHEGTASKEDILRVLKQAKEQLL